MILPAFGIVSSIIPTFSRKKLFGYRSMVYATSSIALLSFMVWAHHMFTTGLPVVAELFFMYTTMLIAVPTGVKVFNWLATMWRGSLTFETPMLFAIAFITLFTIGGFSGLMLAMTPADFQYHDTYFVVAHFHYVLVTGAVFSILAAAYYWLPKWTGHMYDERLGQWHFWCSLVSVNVLFFPMHFVGLAGMPRRIPDYALQFADFNMLISLGVLPSACPNCCLSGAWSNASEAEPRRAIGYGRGPRGWNGRSLLPLPITVSRLRRISGRKSVREVI